MSMKAINVKRPSWKETLKENAPLLLPVAHDALTARLIEIAGFKAFQVGGFAMVASMHAVPDVDLEHFGEKSNRVYDIIGASSLPVMIDADDGYGDVKNVTRTVLEYLRMGVSALFIEDQQPPKKCGHMSGKKVIPPEEMVNKIKAADSVRNDKDFFILARTDAIAPEGLDKALERAEKYLKAGADGVYLEGVENEKQIKKIGETFKGVPLATSVLERGGETPWLSPKEFGELGYSMILYPTTVLFQYTYAVQKALGNLLKEKPMPKDSSVTMKEFEKIVDMQYWAKIEKEFS